MDLEDKYLKISTHELNLKNIRDSDFLTIFEFTYGTDMLNHMTTSKINFDNDYLYQIIFKKNVNFVRMSDTNSKTDNGFKILYIPPEDIEEFMNSKYFYIKSKKKLFRLRLNFTKISQEYDGVFIDTDKNSFLQLDPEYQKLYDTIVYPLGYMFYPKEMIAKLVEIEI